MYFEPHKKSKIHNTKSLMLIFTVIMFLGISFAAVYYVYNYKDSRTNNVISGLIDIDFQKLSENITLSEDKAVPMVDALGKQNDPYEFTVKNISEVPISVYISLNINSITIDKSALKYALYIDDKEVRTSNLAELDDQNTLYIVDNLDPNDIVKVKIVFWIDYYYEKTNESFDANIKVVGESKDYIAETKIYASDKIKEQIISHTSSACTPTVEDSDGTIYFSGDNDCVNFNYVWYSGKLWRITAIYPDDTMKMVTEDAITAIYWNSSNNVTYDKSWIYQWLNEDFKDTLYNYENIIVQNANWNATTDGNSIPIKPPTDASATIVHGDVGLLNAYEYTQAYKNVSSSTNYLNIGYWWWLITPYSNTNILFVGNDGGVFNNTPISFASGVRPSVNLKSNVELIGEGTKNDPYMITIDKATGAIGELINKRNSGEYVKVDNKDYRIVGIEENGTTKLTSVDYVRDEGNTVITKKFGSDSSWSTSVESASDDYWGYYLNNTWLTPELKNYITEGTYYLGKYGIVSYKNTICSEYDTSELTKSCTKTNSFWTGYVGLPRVGEMFSAKFGSESSKSNSMWLITPENASINRFVQNFNYVGISSSSSSSYGARPSINLKSEVEIAGGSGTQKDPYEIALPKKE